MTDGPMQGSVDDGGDTAPAQGTAREASTAGRRDRLVAGSPWRDARSAALGLVALFCLVAALAVVHLLPAPWGTWLRYVLVGLALGGFALAATARGIGGGVGEDDLRKLR